MEQCVRQLLELDENRAMAQLASLSAYTQGTKACANSGTTASKTASKSGTGSTSTYQMSTDSSSTAAESSSPVNDGYESSGNEGQAKPSASQLPVPPALAPNFSAAADAKACMLQAPQGQPMKIDTSTATDRLQHATEVLQAALAHWESCVQSTDGSSKQQSENYKHIREELTACTQAMQQAPARSAPRLPTSPPAAAAVPWSRQAEGATTDAMQKEVLQAALAHWETKLEAQPPAHRPASLAQRVGSCSILPPAQEPPVQPQPSLRQQLASVPLTHEPARVVPSEGREGLTEKALQDLANALHSGDASIAGDLASALASLSASSGPPSTVLEAQKEIQALRLLRSSSERHQEAEAQRIAQIMQQAGALRQQQASPTAVNRAAGLDIAAHSTAFAAAEQAAAAWRHQEMGWQQASYPSKPPGMMLQNMMPPGMLQPGLMPGQGIRRSPTYAHAPRSPDNVSPSSGGAQPAGLRVKPAPAELPVPGADETLRTHLRDLQKVSSDRVVLVRKINRLGFESADVLKQHYSMYGTVDRVLVAHSHVKSQNRRCGSRLRPSGLGFVVMGSKQEAEAILEDGLDQLIQAGETNKKAVTIRVQSFERRTDADGLEDDTLEFEIEGEYLGG